MGTLRAFFRDRPAWAALLLAAALCLKVFVPAGYMPNATSQGISVALCSGTMPAAGMGGMAMGAMGPMGPRTITIPTRGEHPDHTGSTADHPCAFAPLSAAMTGADFAPLLLAALAFVFIIAIVRKVQAPPAAPARIRPPSHGPPRLS